MVRAVCSEEEFINLWLQHGSSKKIADILGMNVRKVYERRRRIEKRLKVSLEPKHINPAFLSHYELNQHDAIKYLDIQNGIALVGSDAHYWPGIITPAHRAFVAFIKVMKPKAVILNGDVLDGSTISRFPPLGWTDSDKPSLISEMEACQERLGEIENACPPGCEKIWTLGNHDGRFESKLAVAAPQFVKIHGMHLKDHFPLWKPAWSCWINNDVVVKHRFKGGIHATHNNTVTSGKTMVTGHLHSLKVTPFSDYNGTRWGVDTGTLSDCYGPQTADYTEMSPVNWRSGFVVLTFHNGQLLDPETVRVVDAEHVCFRGAVHRV